MSNSRAIFTVPGKPKTKGRHRTTKSGHTYTPADTVEWENLVRMAFRAENPDWVPGGGPCTLRIEAVFPVPKSWSKKKRQQAFDREIFPIVHPDWDNIGKAVGDSLNHIAYNDDRQIVSAIVNKNYGVIPCVEVTLDRVIILDRINVKEA